MAPLLEKYLEKCKKVWGRIPNFISVDHANRHSSTYGGIKLYEIIKKLNKEPVRAYYADETVFKAVETAKGEPD